jgi:hypothetical protein
MLRESITDGFISDTYFSVSVLERLGEGVLLFDPFF